MGTNESAETKGKCHHKKGISPRMSKDRGICHSVRKRMIKHNRKRSHGEKRDTYLTNTQRQGRTNSMAIGAHYSSSYGMMMA